MANWLRRKCESARRPVRTSSRFTVAVPVSLVLVPGLSPLHATIVPPLKSLDLKHFHSIEWVIPAVSVLRVKKIGLINSV
jgi:hypothetical protein